MKVDPERKATMRLPTAFALGAAIAFFFDQRLGKGRRHQLRDRLLRLLRRAGRLLAGKTKFYAGHARGAAAEARSTVLPPDVPTDDATVKQRIMSDALRGVPGAASDVQVSVENGVVRLFGTVPEQNLADDLVDRVRKVPGVRGVEPELTVGAGVGTDEGAKS